MQSVHVVGVRPAAAPNVGGAGVRCRSGRGAPLEDTAPNVAAPNVGGAPLEDGPPWKQSPPTWPEQIFAATVGAELPGSSRPQRGRSPATPPPPPDREAARWPRAAPRAAAIQGNAGAARQRDLRGAHPAPGGRGGAVSQIEVSESSFKILFQIYRYKVGPGPYGMDSFGPVDWRNVELILG